MENKSLEQGRLYETRLIVPVFNAAGERDEETPLHVQTYLCQEFGGYTMTSGTGAWATPTSPLPTTEPILIFDVAAPDSSLARAMFTSLASTIADRMGQEAVYVRHGNGQVEFVEGVG